MSWSQEPALYIGLFEAVLALAVAFGLDLSGEQVGAILAVATTFGAVVTRSQVYSPATHEVELHNARHNG